MSIAAAVLETLRAEAANHGGARVARAGLRIGELSGVEPESLRFCSKPWSQAAISIPRLRFRNLPLDRRCRACGAVFRVLEWNPPAPLAAPRHRAPG